VSLYNMIIMNTKL